MLAHVRGRVALGAVIVVSAAVLVAPTSAVGARPTTTSYVLNAAGAPVAVSDATMTRDSRYVAFSTPVALDPGDVNGVNDVYLRDRSTNVITWVSRPAPDAPPGAPSGPSSGPSISDDGTVVAFASSSRVLTAGYAGTGGSLVYVRDLAAGTTRMVSTRVDGSAPGSTGVWFPVISGDASVALFTGQGASFGAVGEPAGDRQFAVDLATGAVERVDLGVGGALANGSVFTWPGLNGTNAAVSTDGRFVAFASSASNLVANDTNGHGDVFVRDRSTGTTTRVSVLSGGGQANDDSFFPSISGDGQTVLYTSLASNLVVNDDNDAFDAFVTSRTLGSTTRVSVTNAGGTLAEGAYAQRISADGRFVTYSTQAKVLTTDNDPYQDIYRYDRTLGRSDRVTLTDEGDQLPPGPALTVAALSTHGRHVLLTTGTARDSGDNAAPRALPVVSDVAERTVTVDASGSTDADGWITGYRWTFGDGTTASGARGPHDFPADGRYVIALTVTDNDGAEHTAFIGQDVDGPEPPPPAPPAPATLSAVAPPVVGGVVRVGELLTCTPGQWDAAATFTYRWVRDDGAVIAEGAQSRLVPALAGRSVRCEVAASAPGHTDAAASSQALVVAPGPAAAISRAPRVIGRLAVGSKLRCSAGSWSRPVTATYRWTRDGRAIAKATARTYRLRAADARHRIRCSVTARTLGYTSKTVTAKATARVKKAKKR
ncbi:PKD domain-containing protein [Galbitalea sp. SE-J8]|uniref:PKD domain-containing protein n=1 Tax=Galbitalea sp. SE-J8 TaxID=3054952 RepID=UPI00259D29B0|nr:PKD domain-containing protein [Galbitalea sp. SE-J8]MDM4763935.1 PKD domain-containing protein [Galbitalea sp. SE-J8]